MEHRQYEPEFKRQVARQHIELKRPVSHLAVELDIPDGCIYRWVKQYREDPEHAFPGSGHVKPDEDEVRKLRRQMMELQEENEILKKAAAYFAKLHR